jgi:cytochrome d ubiquinol oxidase subunit I
MKLLPFAIALPYLANTTGWLLTELGRQPWIVFGLMTVDKAVSPTVPWSSMLFSLIVLTVLITGLVAVDAWLLVKYARKGIVEQSGVAADEEPGLLTSSIAK